MVMLFTEIKGFQGNDDKFWKCCDGVPGKIQKEISNCDKVCVLIPSFACRYLVVSTPVLENTVFAPFYYFVPLSKIA